MTPHIMLDLETLGTSPGCAIVSIGACKFSSEGILDEFYRVVVPEATMRIDVSTTLWWLQQSVEARQIFSADTPKLSMLTALIKLTEWGENCPKLWGHGAAFDAPILQAAYEHHGYKCPWAFNNWRDTRTVYEMSGIYPDRQVGTHHNALDDAKAQALAVIASFKKLNVEFA